jgi:hypothetical protein
MNVENAVRTLNLTFPVAIDSNAHRRVFRGKFVAALKSAFQHGQLHFSGDLALLAQPRSSLPG